jgi:hypothetical protein
MTEPYRSPALRDPPTVIVYRNLSPLGPIAFLVLLSAMMVFVSHRVTLHCERSFPPQIPGGFCESHDESLVGSPRVERFDLGRITGARLSRGNKGATKVVLTTPSGYADMTGRLESSNDVQKSTFIGAVQGFVADKEAGVLNVSYGSRWADNLVFLVFLLPVTGLLLLMTRRVRVIVDGASREVRVQRSRFPLPPSEEGYELDEVTGAEIQESTGSKGGTVYRVALRFRNGSTMPLRDGYTSGRGAKEKAVARIVEALRGARS